MTSNEQAERIGKRRNWMIRLLLWGVRKLHGTVAGFNSPGTSALKFTLFGVLTSLLLALFSIGMIWFVSTPMFDIRGFLANLWETIVIFKGPLMLAIIGVLLCLSILSRRAFESVIFAFLIKVVTGTYMTGLVMITITKFMIDNQYFEGPWIENLPLASVYPTGPLVITVLLWGITWFCVLSARKYVKGIRKDEGKPYDDFYDSAERFLDKLLKSLASGPTGKEPMGPQGDQ